MSVLSKLAIGSIAAVALYKVGSKSRTQAAAQAEPARATPSADKKRRSPAKRRASAKRAKTA
jgi:hypothetical protein